MNSHDKFVFNVGRLLGLLHGICIENSKIEAMAGVMGEIRNYIYGTEHVKEKPNED